MVVGSFDKADLSSPLINCAVNLVNLQSEEVNLGAQKEGEMQKCLTVYLITVLIFTLILSGCRGDSSDTPVASKTWGTAEVLETDSASRTATEPQISCDRSGNAIAVWLSLETIGEHTKSCTKARRYIAESGWATPELIGTDDAWRDNDPQITVNESGDAVAVWQQFDGAQYRIMANHYTAGSGWGKAEPIMSPNDGTTLFPQIALDEAGNAIAVWYQYDGTRFNIMANSYLAGFGWGTAELIEADDTGDAKNPHIAMDNSGLAIAIWVQDDGTQSKIMSNQFTTLSGWDTPELIEVNARYGSFPQVAFDSSGDAIAVLTHDDGTRSSIMAVRHTAGIGWGAPEQISTDGIGGGRRPQIAFDYSGNAIAVWRQFDGSWSNIMANRYTPSLGWGTAQLIETAPGNAFNPQIGLDRLGNAIAVWYQYDESLSNIMANRHVPGFGWSTAELIGTNDARDPQIAMDSFGNATVVWQQQGSTRFNIMVNRFE